MNEGDELFDIEGGDDEEEEDDDDEGDFDYIEDKLLAKSNNIGQNEQHRTVLSNLINGESADKGVKK